ncbi:PGL/p-HBAD biosynthesis glycosyltransferase/MT3031 [bacterium BMS3Abin14]|nr:PGL/p-HBAD biosynthesis glycosyltransferase/MT3031 [bacterium BMS3Abin14]
MAFFPASRRITGEIRTFLSSPRFSTGSPPPQDSAWPRISVITPSFNQVEFLERTIISVHNQEYPNFEHIVIDGGSTDGSVDIIKRYGKVLKYWHSRPDRGQCDAINMGADIATGRFMTWINSDDLLLPGALMKVGTVIRDNPGLDLVYGNQVEIDRNDVVTKRVFTVDFDIYDFLYEVNIIIKQQSAFWNADLFERIGGLNDCPYAMDYDLFYRMFGQGMRYRRLDDFLSAFRVYPESLTGSGEVNRSRGDTVDTIFADYLGRERGLLDRTVIKAWYKTRRFAKEPRAFAAALEHRLGRLSGRLRKTARRLKVHSSSSDS